MIDWSKKSLVISGAPVGSEYYYLGKPSQKSNVFTAGPDGELFAAGVLYQLYAYHEDLLPDPRLFALRFREDGSIEALNSFEAGPGAGLPAGQPVSKPPEPAPIDTRTALLASLQFDLLVRCAQGGYPDFDEADFDPKDFDSTPLNPNDPLMNSADFDSNDFYTA